MSVEQTSSTPKQPSEIPTEQVQKPEFLNIFGLTVEPPHMDKSYFLCYKPTDELHGRALRYAVLKVLPENSIKPFLQYGHHNPMDDQKWEPMFPRATPDLGEKLKTLLPEIEKEALYFLELWKE